MRASAGCTALSETRKHRSEKTITPRRKTLLSCCHRFTGVFRKASDRVGTFKTFTAMPNLVSINGQVQATAVQFSAYVLGNPGLNGAASNWGLEAAHLERCFDAVQSFDRTQGGAGTPMHVQGQTVFHLSHQTSTVFFYQETAVPRTYRIVALGKHATEESGTGRVRDPRRRSATYNIKWRDTGVLAADSSLRQNAVSL